MTIKNQIAAATAMFTDPTVFGESLELYPRGDVANKVAFDGVFDEDALPGTNEATGDGRVINKPTERRERHSAIVEAPISVRSSVADKQDPSRPDLIKRVSTGQIWGVKRIMGEDPAMFSLLVIRGQNAVQRHSRSRQG